MKGWERGEGGREMRDGREGWPGVKGWEVR